MPRKCNSCNGSYQPTQKDGSNYYHTCAPVGRKPNGETIEHPHKRDENIKLDAKGERAGIIAEGDGAETAPEE
jgi:hypothetical protein